MILQPIDFVLYAWLIIAVLSAVYVAYDQFRHNPEVAVNNNVEEKGAGGLMVLVDVSP